MNALRLAGTSGALALLLVSAAWASDGVLRGSLPVAAPQSVDPPGLLITRLPSGALLKQMPGQPIPAEPAGTPTARVVGLARGVSVQQVGAAQMQVLGNSPVVLQTSPPGEVSVRQIGNASLRETAGVRSSPAATLKVAAPLPPGVRVVDLPAGQPLPANPAPNTLYRQLRD